MTEKIAGKCVCPYATRRCNSDCKAYVTDETCFITEINIQIVNSLHRIEDQLAGGSLDIKTTI